MSDLIDELKPVRCRCGGEAKIAKKYLMGNLPDVYVFCKNCSIRTKEYYSEAEAIMEWNQVMSERTTKVYKKQAPDRWYYFYCGVCGEMIDCSSYEDYKSIKSYCGYCGTKLDWGGNERFD